MAGLAKNSAAARWICHPITTVDPRRIDAAVKHSGTSASRQLFLQSYIRWRKTAVETDRQMLATFLNSGPELTALVFGQRHWFFQKYVLARPQSRECLRCVQRIPARNH